VGRKKHRAIVVGDTYDTNLYGVVVVSKFIKGIILKVVFKETGYETTTSLDRLRGGNIVDPIQKSQNTPKTVGVGLYDWWVIEDTLTTADKRKMYLLWWNLLTRCYDELSLVKHPTYRGCSVCEEWLTFSVFRSWVLTQDWRGNDLDKDILYKGNKLYSPDTCVYVTNVVNCFSNITKSNDVSTTLIGSYYRESSGKYLSSVSNPFTHKQEFLGSFSTDVEAHLAWKKRKHEIACMLADSDKVTDNRVSLILKNTYINYNTVEDY